MSGETLRVSPLTQISCAEEGAEVLSLKVTVTSFALDPDAVSRYNALRSGEMMTGQDESPNALT